MTIFSSRLKKNKNIVVLKGNDHKVIIKGTRMRVKQIVRVLACLFLLFLISLSACDKSATPPPKQESTLERIKQTGVLRVGYGGYPPYLVKSAAGGQVSGMSVDMINRIVEIWDRKIRIEWVETSWDRVKADMLAGKFDMIVEPLFQTIPRASEVAFTRPYTFSGYGVAIVRINESRFSKLSDFDAPNIVLAVNQNVSSYDFIKRTMPKATLTILPTGNLDQPMVEVMLGKADAAFADVPTVTRCLQAQPDQIKALFLENPPISAAAGFMIPQGDFAWTAFLNTCLDYLDNSGELEAMLHRYNLPYYRTTRERILPPVGQ